MKITKTSERYLIEHRDKSIIVEKLSNGHLNVEPNGFCEYHNEGFVFKGSKPNTLEIIGEMLVEASKL